MSYPARAEGLVNIYIYIYIYITIERYWNTPTVFPIDSLSGSSMIHYLVVRVLFRSGENLENNFFFCYEIHYCIDTMVSKHPVLFIKISICRFFCDLVILTDIYQ